MESHHCSNCFIFRPRRSQCKQSNTVFALPSNLPGTCTCMWFVNAVPCQMTLCCSLLSLVQLLHHHCVNTLLQSKWMRGVFSYRCNVGLNGTQHSLIASAARSTGLVCSPVSTRPIEPEEMRKGSMGGSKKYTISAVHIHTHAHTDKNTDIQLHSAHPITRWGKRLVKLAILSWIQKATAPRANMTSKLCRY